MSMRTTGQATLATQVLLAVVGAHIYQRNFGSIVGLALAPSMVSPLNTYVKSSEGNFCSASPWKRLFVALDDAYHNSAYREEFHEGVLGLIEEFDMAWYKDHYQDCVEGLLSLVLYLSYHNGNRREQFLELASGVARELNPLALRHGLSSWPMFNRLGELHLIWQGGERAHPLVTEPWKPSLCCKDVPRIISPLMTALGQNAMQLLKRLKPGAFVVDAGVFDGTDWTMQSVLEGATVLGFEPSARNLRLFEQRFPLALGQARPETIASGAGQVSCRRHTMLRVEPGEHAPRIGWATVFPPSSHDASSCIEPHSEAQMAQKRAGHAFILSAALGERVKAINITTKYDYTSIADQGYLSGPKDMKTEEVAMTTLDEVFNSYLSIHGDVPGWIDLLKIDVEGYEMGALRGAEQLLADGRVHYLVLEFHPGMLGTTGTDPQGLLEFVSHYCFLCHSSKIDRPHTLEDFVARYITDPKALPLQGLGALEDLVCQNLRFSGGPRSVH